MLARLTLRQCLLALSLLLVLLVGGAWGTSLWTLDRVVQHSRDALSRALTLTANAQRLDERGASLQRNARQYMVMADPVYRANFRSSLAEAGRALGAIEQGLPRSVAPTAAAWRRASAEADHLLEQGASKRPADVAAVAQALAPLPGLQAQLVAEARREVHRRNLALLEVLDQRRWQMALLAAAALLFAFVFAIMAAARLGRPMAALGAAIAQLGAQRYDKPIAIAGPRDLRQLGEQLELMRQRLAGTATPSAAPTPMAEADLAALMLLAIDSRRAAAASAGVALKASGAAPPMPVDRERVLAALSELLQNAIGASVPGATAWVGLSRRADAACFDFIDTGEAAATRAEGLRIARGCAELHGGKLELLPSPRGAHFRLSLPYPS